MVKSSKRGIKFPAEESKLLGRLNTISTYGKGRRGKPRLKKDSTMYVLADIFNDEEDGRNLKLVVNKMPPPKKLVKKKKLGFKATSTPMNTIIMSLPLKSNAVVAIQSNITKGLPVIQKQRINGKLAAKLRIRQKVEKLVEEPEVLIEENDNYDDFILLLPDDPAEHEIMDTKLKGIDSERKQQGSTTYKSAKKKVAAITTLKVAKPKNTRLIRNVKVSKELSKVDKDNTESNGIEFATNSPGIRPSNGGSSSKKKQKKTKTSKPKLTIPTQLTTGRTFETDSPGVTLGSSKSNKKSLAKNPIKRVTIVHHPSSRPSKSRDWIQKYRKTNYTYNELFKMCTKGVDPINFLSKMKKVS